MPATWPTTDTPRGLGRPYAAPTFDRRNRMVRPRGGRPVALVPATAPQAADSRRAARFAAVHPTTFRLPDHRDVARHAPHRHAALRGE